MCSDYMAANKARRRQPEKVPRKFDKTFVPRGFNQVQEQNFDQNPMNQTNKQTQKRYLVVPKPLNGFCRAVSQFDVKDRDVTVAAQFARQSVTASLPQRRHPARKSRPGRFANPAQTNVAETDRRNTSRSSVARCSGAFSPRVVTSRET